MTSILLPIAAAIAAQSPAPAALPELAPAEAEAVGCAATFAIVTWAQERGDPTASGYPPLGDRGREYFVRVTAKLMEEKSMSREDVSRLLSRQAEELTTPQAISDAMPQCLLLLDAAGL